MFLSADFLSSYLSGAVGILIGNPLDILKVRLQAASRSTPASSSSLPSTESTAAATASTQKTTALRTFTHGTLAPLLTYGALNALLFVTYNRTLSLLSSFHGSNSPSPSNGSISSVQESSSLDPRLSDTFTAGVLAGLATWVVSTPTELLKCRVQLHSIGPEAGRRPRGEDSGGTWNTARHVWKREGIRGFYVGGTVTAIRDSIGYGFYFYTYALLRTLLPPSQYHEPFTTLVSGGFAGIVSWASIFPLDVIKTRVQTMASMPASNEPNTPLLEKSARKGAVQIAREAYRQEGAGVFFRGLGICSARAFAVNAVQWGVYEWMMRALGEGRR